MPHFETIVDRVFLHLLFPSLDPNSVVEYESEASCNALEIAAMNRNEPAFNLLAPHCDDELKKKMARLVLIGLAEKTPSDEFKTLFSSIPMHKVKLQNTNRVPMC